MGAAELLAALQRSNAELIEAILSLSPDEAARKGYVFAADADGRRAVVITTRLIDEMARNAAMVAIAEIGDLL